MARRAQGPARKRAVTTPGDKPDEELDAFRRRQEWWQEVVGDRTGCLDPEARRLSRSATWDGTGQSFSRRSTLAARHQSGDPGLGPRAVRRGGWRGTDNPRPRSSLGFVGTPLRLTGERLRGSVLKVALPTDDKLVDLGTVRVFRFDEVSGEWELVERSAVAADRSFAWAHVRDRSRTR